MSTSHRLKRAISHGTVTMIAAVAIGQYKRRLLKQTSGVVQGVGH